MCSSDLHAPDRLLSPGRLVSEGGERESPEWHDVVPRLRAELAAAGHLAVAVSPMLTLEEAWMLCAVARSIDPEAFLAVVAAAGGNFLVIEQRRSAVRDYVAIYDFNEQAAAAVAACRQRHAL